MHDIIKDNVITNHLLVLITNVWQNLWVFLETIRSKNSLCNISYGTIPFCTVVSIVFNPITLIDLFFGWSFYFCRCLIIQDRGFYLRSLSLTQNLKIVDTGTIYAQGIGGIRKPVVTFGWQQVSWICATSPVLHFHCVTCVVSIVFNPITFIDLFFGLRDLDFYLRSVGIAQNCWCGPTWGHIVDFW